MLYFVSKEAVHVNITKSTPRAHQIQSIEAKTFLVFVSTYPAKHSSLTPRNWTINACSSFTKGLTISSSGKYGNIFAPKTVYNWFT